MSFFLQEKEDDIQYSRLDEENVLEPTEAAKVRIRHSQDLAAEEQAALLKSQGTNGATIIRKKSSMWCFTTIHKMFSAKLF